MPRQVAEAKAKRLASDLSTSLPQPTGNTSQLLPCSALAVVSIKEVDSERMLESASVVRTRIAQVESFAFGSEAEPMNRLHYVPINSLVQKMDWTAPPLDP